MKQVSVPFSLETVFFLSKTPTLLEVKAQLRRTGEQATHPSPTRGIGPSRLHFRLNGRPRPRTVLGAGTGSSRGGGGIVMFNPYFSLIADLAAGPQRTILKQLN